MVINTLAVTAQLVKGDQLIGHGKHLIVGLLEKLVEPCPLLQVHSDTQREHHIQASISGAARTSKINNKHKKHVTKQAKSIL